MRPDLLLIDEPTASLGPPMRSRIFSIFGDLSRQGKTLVLATHGLEIAKRWADYVVVMQHGRVAIAGPPDSVFQESSLMTEFGFAEPWYWSL